MQCKRKCRCQSGIERNPYCLTITVRAVELPAFICPGGVATAISAVPRAIRNKVGGDRRDAADNRHFRNLNLATAGLLFDNSALIETPARTGWTVKSAPRCVLGSSCTV